MNRYAAYVFLAGAVALVSMGHNPAHTQDGQPPGPPRKFPDFDAVVKGAKEYDGLFRLYHKEDNLFAEVQPFQFNTPYLLPIAVARGMAMGAHTLNDDEQWVVLFRRVGDRVFLIRRNVRFQARGGAVAKAVETTYTDSVLMALPIRSVHPMRSSVLINLNDIFMTNFAGLRGMFDPSRSTWAKVKSFPRNIELQVSATYAGLRGGDSVIDPRGTTIVLHYGLCAMPEAGYQPRLADDRVGYFLSVVKDYTNDTKATPFLRYVNRWRLERADGSAWKEGGKLVQPKKKIVFWIEKSVPEEYRGYVRDGILEWNKAFAKVGFRDAIEVRQQENEDFDPEDINYNTFRWITTDRGFAMGPSRANPLTGEILDADIIFDASMVRYYRRDAEVFGNKAAAMSAEDISPIRAARKNIGLAGVEPGDGWDTRDALSLDPLDARRKRGIMAGSCECGTNLKRELNLLAAAIQLRDNAAAPPTGATAGILAEELIGQAIKETTMHEVGHTLGLRHNFKASTMLDNKDLHNTEITRSKGLVGSVMDYTPVNLAPKGVKQGDYFTNVLGPYDFWAIEYAYKPIGGTTESELEELKKVAAKCATPGYDFSTDEDAYSSSDPYVNLWDLGADPMKFAQGRILLAEELMAKLADKGGKPGDGYQDVRGTFAVLLREYGNGAHLVSRFVGGVKMHRDHIGDPNGREPFVVVPPDKQREALAFLKGHILTDNYFKFSPKLLRRLGSDRWLHWGSSVSMFGNIEYPVHDRVLKVQKVVLDHVLDPGTLARIQDNALKADAGTKPLGLDEVFACLTEAVWTTPTKVAPGKDAALSVVTRNLQREHVKELIDLVVKSSSAPADAKSLARMHLGMIAKQIDGANGAKWDAVTAAHFAETRERIAKALAAGMQLSQ